MLAVVGVGSWLVAIVARLSRLGLAGLTDLSLYPLYAAAGVLGWGLGNVWVVRRRGLAASARRALLPVYLLAPVGVLFLAWSTTDAGRQLAIPLAPVYAAGVFAVLFLVPVSFARR